MDTMNTTNRIRRKHSSTKSTTRKLPKSTTLKLYTQPKLQSKAISDWKNQSRFIMGLPIYLISCHSTICVSYKACGITSKPKSTIKGMPTFTLPESVFVLNITSGAEYCYSGDVLSDDIYNQSSDIKKLLLVEDRDEIEMRNLLNSKSSNSNSNASNSSNSSIKPLIRRFNRATNVVYPNLSCTFVEHDKRYRKNNDLGVFNLETTHTPIRSKNSLIPATEAGPYPEDPELWFLEDIINRISPTNAIFVLVACSTIQIDKNSTNNINGIENITDTVQTMIYRADLLYNSLVPTLDIKTIESVDSSKVPYNYGSEPSYLPTSTTMVLTALAMNEPIGSVYPKPKSKSKSKTKKPSNLQVEYNKEFKKAENLLNTTGYSP